MRKKKRELIHEKLLNNVGVDYSSFIPLETATILNLTIKSNSNYRKLLDKLQNQSDFLLKSIMNSNISFDQYELLIKEINKKKNELKENEIKKIELKIKELKNQIMELRK